MGTMINKLLSLFSRKKPTCPHSNCTEHKYRLEDKTPMVYWICHDCFESDRGYVLTMDIENPWTEEECLAATKHTPSM